MNTFNTSKSKFLAALLAALFASVGFADDATYSPTPKTLSGTLPYSDSYVLTITSPAKLTGGPSTPFPAEGVIVTPRVSEVVVPAGADEDTAKGYVSFSVASLTYTAFNQPQSFTVFVNFPAGAVVGDYHYTIQGVPNKPGWGLSGATLSVSVSEPVVTDTTPPMVQINSPSNGASFTYCLDGRSVSIEVAANDAESAVTAVSAAVDGSAVGLTTVGLGTNNVTASGSYTAVSIGSYVVTAEATSAGGTGTADAVTFSVNYDLTWLPPLSLGKTDKGGSTVPVKFTIKDCEGRFVRDESVSVAAFRNGSLDPVFVATFGDGSDFVRIDEGDPLIDTDGHYIANLKTATGVGSYLIVVYFGGTNNGNAIEAIQQGTKTFNTR